jgi:excisionase family DNA binding protein
MSPPPPHGGASTSPGAVDGRNTLLTAGQLAGRWQVTTAQVYRLTREGRIPVVPIGRYRRYRLTAIEAWEREQEGATEG